MNLRTRESVKKSEIFPDVLNGNPLMSASSSTDAKEFEFHCLLREPAVVGGGGTGIDIKLT